MSSFRLTESEITTDIRRVARLLGHSPSSVEYRRLGRYNLRTIQRKFKMSWGRIVAAAGLRYTPRTSYPIPPTEELKRDLLSVERQLGHPPTRAQYQSLGRFSGEAVRRRSGKKNWEDALAALLGVCREEVKRWQQKGGCYRTTEEWLIRLGKLSQRLGHAPTTREANESGINAHELRRRVGGQWLDVLKAAGIDPRSRSAYARLRSASTEELIEDVVRVSQSLGRPARMREYETGGCYSHAALIRRLHGWRQVKKVVQERLNEDRSRDGGPPRLAQKYLDMKHLQIVAVGDSAKIKEGLSEYGIVETYESKPITNK